MNFKVEGPWNIEKQITSPWLANMTKTVKI